VIESTHWIAHSQFWLLVLDFVTAPFGQVIFLSRSLARLEIRWRKIWTVISFSSNRIAIQLIQRTQCYVQTSGDHDKFAIIKASSVWDIVSIRPRERGITECCLCSIFHHQLLSLKWLFPFPLCRFLGSISDICLESEIRATVPGE
jgi:hypothetical protein